MDTCHPSLLMRLLLRRRWNTLLSPLDSLEHSSHFSIGVVAKTEDTVYNYASSCVFIHEYIENDILSLHWIIFSQLQHISTYTVNESVESFIKLSRRERRSSLRCVRDDWTGLRRMLDTHVRTYKIKLHTRTCYSVINWTLGAAKPLDKVPIGTFYAFEGVALNRTGFLIKCSEYNTGFSCETDRRVRTLTNWNRF